MDNNTCRLCLISRYDNDFDIIEEVTIQMLDTLVLKLDLTVSEKPVMCNECAELLQISFDFKSNIVHIASEALDKETPVAPNETTSDIKEQVCSFCATITSDLLNLNESKENIFIVNTIRNHIPELNPNSDGTLMICASCLNTVHSFSFFIISCLNIEKKIKDYIKLNGRNEMGHIDLNNISYQTSGEVSQQTGLFFKVEVDGNENISESRGICVKNEIEAENEDGDNDSVKMAYAMVVSAPEPVATADGDDDKIVKCTKCSVKTKQKYMLMHMLTHKDSANAQDYRACPCLRDDKKKPFTCPHCSFETKRKDRLENHLIIHLDSKELTKYKCNVGKCKYQTVRVDYLQRHVKLMHGDPMKQKIRKCELCDYQSKFRRNLKKHMLVHKELGLVTTIFECPFCSFTSNRKCTLGKHMVTHEEGANVEWFDCDKCSYRGERKEDLILHLQTHKEVVEMSVGNA